MKVKDQIKQSIKRDGFHALNSLHRKSPSTVTALIHSLLEKIEAHEFYKFFFYEKSNMFELFLARLTSAIKKKKLEMGAVKGLVNVIRRKLRVPCFAGPHLFAAVVALVRYKLRGKTASPKSSGDGTRRCASCSSWRTSSSCSCSAAKSPRSGSSTTCSGVSS